MSRGISEPPVSEGAQPDVAAARPSDSPVDAYALQRLVDEAGCFNLFSRPVAVMAIRHQDKVVGFRSHESLHRFDVRTYPETSANVLRASNTIGEQVGYQVQHYMFIPDDYAAAPDRLAPPTPFDQSRTQRFMILNSTCIFGNGDDGFHGFGAGHTLPSMIQSRPQFSTMSNGTIITGFGKFFGQEGTFVSCGTFDPDHGFTGNVMLRVMDRRHTLGTWNSLPCIRPSATTESDITYMVIRGEAEPNDPVSPNVGPDGRQNGLIVQQSLKMLHIDCATGGREGLRARARVGLDIGRITAHVVFDPALATGTALDPVPFTAYDEFVFVDREGRTTGTFTAESSEGRVFRTLVSGYSALRFGGVGRIRGGTGCCEGIGGLMTDNSVVIFTPHVSASIYVLRIDDPDGRFRMLKSP